MAVGTALRFQRDPDGRPHVMYIRDCLAACSVCGREVIQRGYDQTSYHHLTVARFRALAMEAPQGWAAADCEQCGEPMTAAEVRRWAITYGFPQEHGLVQGFGRLGVEGPEVEYAVSPHRRFDVQMLPEWEPEDDQSVARGGHLSEEWARPLLGRYFSLKAGWRRGLARWAENGGGVETVELAEGCWGIIGAAAEGLKQARLALMGQDAADGWVELDLGDGITELLDDGPSRWLPADWYDGLREGRPRALGVARVAAAEGLLRSALAGLPGPTDCEVAADGCVKVGFPLGDEGVYRVTLSLRELLGEALATGAAPGDRVGLWLDDRLTELAAGEDE